MNTILIIALALAATAVVFVLVQRQRLIHQRNRAIAQSLDAIRLSADQSRLRGLVTELDVEADFNNLRELAQHCPSDVMKTLQDLEERWREVQRRLDEFKSQDTVSTLQSSVTMVKTDQLVDEIFELSRKVETGLGDRSAKN